MPLTSECGTRSEIDRCIEDRLAGCSYSYYFNRIDWQFEDGVLTLSGQVPSFYLKQVLQTVLRRVENVERLVNDVDVVSSNGLSSVR